MRNIKKVSAMCVVLAVVAFLAAGCGFAVPGDMGGVADTVSHSGMELPAVTEGEDIVVHLGYTASYNHLTLCPDWVAWELTAEEASGELDGQYSFSWDPTVKSPKATREDYSRSGWDKGHMAPRADMKWSYQALEESYFFTNICPQDHEMNSQAWRKIEELTRRMARRHGSVLVVCGPVYDNEEHTHIGPNCVHVPDRFYKALAVRAGEEWQTVGFLVENNRQNRSPRSYAVPVDSVEAVLTATRHAAVPVDLFPQLPAASEATYNWNIWNR